MLRGACHGRGDVNIACYLEDALIDSEVLCKAVPSTISTVPNKSEPHLPVSVKQHGLRMP